MNGTGTVAALLLHGLCSTPLELAPVQEALRAAGHAVQPLPVRGYSYDAAQPTQRATPYREWLHAVAQEARRQHAHGRRVVLVGLSAGSLLALGALAHCAGVVDGVVLMSTPLRLDGWAVPRHHFLMPLALYTPLGRFWRYRERPPYGVKNLRVRRWIEREMTARQISRAGAAIIDVPHLREHDRLRRSVLRQLPLLHCPPVLALHAREDEVAGPANVALLQQRLHTPSFRAVLLPDSHHMITIDNDRAQVVEEILRFFEQLKSGFAAAPSAPHLQETPHVRAHL